MALNFELAADDALPEDTSSSSPRVELLMETFKKCLKYGLRSPGLEVRYTCHSAKCKFQNYKRWPCDAPVTGDAGLVPSNTWSCRGSSASAVPPAAASY